LIKNCLSGADSRAGTLETIFKGLAETAEERSNARRVYAEFSVTGLARFLAHSELLTAMERACVRAGMDLQYSEGFNPRPRMSLPLPKSVGLESTGDVLFLRLRDRGPDVGPVPPCEALQACLVPALPQGITLLSLRMTSRRVSLQPWSAAWTIPIRASERTASLSATVEGLLSQDTLHVDRSKPSSRQKTKRKNIRQYLSSIEISPQQLQVAYRITPEGSVRLDEVLTLLGMTADDLEGPIQRSQIQWYFI